MSVTIGKLLHTHLDKSIVNMDAVKLDIKAALGTDIAGVKIENIDTVNNAETFTISDATKRLTLNKVLELDNNYNLIVKYDLKLNIVSI